MAKRICLAVALVLGLAGATLTYAAATSQPAAACEQHTS
jgi:hypothetical protein